MKAEMAADGVIWLLPESSAEAYALRQWTHTALVVQADPARDEQCHWRGSMLMTDTAWRQP